MLNFFDAIPRRNSTGWRGPRATVLPTIHEEVNLVVTNVFRRESRMSLLSRIDLPRYAPTHLIYEHGSTSGNRQGDPREVQMERKNKLFSLSTFTKQTTFTINVKKMNMQI